MLQFGKNSIKNEKVASPGFELVTKRVVNCSSTTGAYGLFGDDAELSAGVPSAAGELERGVARGHAAAQDHVHERAPHPPPFLLPPRCGP